MRMFLSAKEAKLGNVGAEFQLIPSKDRVNELKMFTLIAGSRRARNLVCTPYLDFGCLFLLPKSIDKSS